MTDESGAQREPQIVASQGPCCQSIEWYAEGELRLVEVDGIQVAVRYVGRKGRRGRIAITAPPGAKFRSVEPRRSVAGQCL
jgi:hypothetical protein